MTHPPLARSPRARAHVTAVPSADDAARPGTTTALPTATRPTIALPTATRPTAARTATARTTTSGDRATTGRIGAVSGPASDVELALRSREDADAFAELYQRYRAPIYRMVYARLRQREAAEDVTSEVFVKALRSIDGYRPSSAPFWGWLYRIAANAVVDHVRARKATTGLETVLERADPAARVEDAVIGRVEAERVWSAVGTLSDAQRTAVVLRLAGDLPIAGIAGRMERSEGAVKQLLNRGMASVRAQLLDAAG